MTEPTAETHIRVMTYNIRLAGRGRRRSLGRVVAALCPDVLLVNESPKAPLLWRWRCRRLAAACGMRYVVGGRDAGSNLVLVGPGVDVVHVGALVLSRQYGRPRRGLAGAVLRRDERVLAVVSAHLSVSRARRRREVQRVVGLADRLAGPALLPVVVAGDLNEPAGGFCWERLRRAGFRDAAGSAPGSATFPADRPASRIDALLARGGLEVLGVVGPPYRPAAGSARGVTPAQLAAASDHLPVCVDLRFTGKG